MTESPAGSPLVLASGPDDGVGVITLNRPEKKNALSIALREEAVALLGRMADDETLKALVITGSGGCFSAGFDLREFTMTDPGHIERIWQSSDRFHHAVHRFPLPVIAAVDGIAYAGGFDLAVLCDLRVATHRATFAHPETTLGPVVYGPLHDLVGGAIARELVLTGREIDAREALRLHLVTELTDPGELIDRALSLARQVSQAPREVLARNKAKFIARSAISPETPTLDL
ncbi:MAG TPA: enoyl-CoA hydratase/isomerase family protein [Trebonia sp.]